MVTSSTLAQDNITSPGTTVKVAKGSSYFSHQPLLKFNCLWHPAFETYVISHHPLMASHHTWNKVQSPYKSWVILALPLRPYFYSLSSLCYRHSALFVSQNMPSEFLPQDLCCSLSLGAYSVKNSHGSRPHLVRSLLSDTSSENHFSSRLLSFYFVSCFILQSTLHYLIYNLFICVIVCLLT